MANSKAKKILLNVVIPIAIVLAAIFTFWYVDSLRPHNQIEDYELAYYEDTAQVKQLFYDNRELFDAAANIFTDEDFVKKGIRGDGGNGSLNVNVGNNIYLLNKEQQKTMIDFYKSIRPIYFQLNGTTTVEICLRGTFDGEDTDECYVLKCCFTDEAYKTSLESFEYRDWYIDIEKLDDKWIFAKSVQGTS